MKFKNERFIKLIQEHLPGFDFEREWSREDLQSIRNVVLKKKDKKREEAGIAMRMAAIKNKSLSPGVEVRLKGKGKTTIKSIGITGYIMLDGKKGSFNPNYVERTT